MLRQVALVVGVGAAVLAPSFAGKAQGLADPGEMRCSLVLSYLGLDPPDYRVFHAWLDGYVAGNLRSGAGERKAGELDLALDYCRKHPDDAFAKASAAVVQK